MERMKASDFPPEVLKIFDGYVHGRISRRQFLDDAKKYAGDLKVIGVDNIDEALQALEESGGDTDVVQQAAAGRTGTTAPH